MKIPGATAVITGAASGLGEATARRFAGLGANVIIADLNQAAGEVLANEIGARFRTTDVTNTADLLGVMDEAATVFGRLDILVNCAGIAPGERILGRNGPHDIDLFRRTIAINLIGTFDALRLAASAMAKNAPNDDGERGVIINTASIAAYEGQIGQAAYAASKGGVVALTITAARDLAAQGIRVCTIAPGTFDTPMLAAFSDDVRESLGKQTPFPPRLGRAADYAALAQHIVENPMLNGETIRLDGALRMPPR